MRCGWGFYFRGAFEAQAGNSPLQGQSKPPAKLVVLIIKLSFTCLRALPQAFLEMLFANGHHHTFSLLHPAIALPDHIVH